MTAASPLGRLGTITSTLAPRSARLSVHCVAALENRPRASIVALAVDPATSVLAVGRYDHPHTGIALFDLATMSERWQQRWSYSSDDNLEALAFSADGLRLWTALSNGRLVCRDVIDGRVQRETRPQGDTVSDVRLCRDARWAVVSGSWNNDPGYGAWGGGDFNDYFTTLVAADAETEAPDKETLVASILASTPAIHHLSRFRKSATLAIASDGMRDIFSVVEGHAAAPIVQLRERSGSVLETLTFHRAQDFAVSGAFAEGDASFWLGTHSGLLFQFA